MGAKKWPDELTPWFKGADVVILPHNDAPGFEHASLVSSKLKDVAKGVRLLELPGLAARGDVADWINAGGTLAKLHELVEAKSTQGVGAVPPPSASVPSASAESKMSAPTFAAVSAKFVPAYKKSIVRLNVCALLEKEFPPRETILKPWLPEKGLAMIFAERGIGKTWIAMNICYAVAGGGSFLGWDAERPRRVVYIDGEMPAAVIQERFSRIVANAAFYLPEDNLQIISADLQPDGLPNLADPNAQQFYDDAIRDAELICVDNLSTVCRVLKENEADSFGPVQEWLLRQRAAGKSVISVHHAGKTGAQRGTSRKEDVLDTVIELRRPPGYDASEGARFEIHFSKSRGFWGEDAKPFEAWLREGQWERYDLSDTGYDVETLRSLKKQGLSYRKIAERVGASKSTVADKLKSWCGDE
jgi:hypothetical protein